MKKNIEYLENGTIQITDENKEYILIGTAHVSSESAKLVRQMIDEQMPDTVCIELDQGRFQTITQKQAWSDHFQTAYRSRNLLPIHVEQPSTSHPLSLV